MVVVMVAVVVMMMVMMVMMIRRSNLHPHLGRLNSASRSVAGKPRIISLQQVRSIRHRIEKVPIAGRAGGVICRCLHRRMSGSDTRHGRGSAEKSYNSLVHLSSKRVISALSTIQ
jgi:hypothetical protein